MRIWPDRVALRRLGALFVSLWRVIYQVVEYTDFVTVFICSSGGLDCNEKQCGEFQAKAIIMWQSGTLDLVMINKEPAGILGKSVAPVVHLKVLLTKIKIDLYLLRIW